jgi:hypothetical protein
VAVNFTPLNANSINNINTNFQRVEEALQKTLGREGDNPNHMNADLDMNSNDILNVNELSADSITIQGLPIGQFNGTFKGSWSSGVDYFTNDVVSDDQGNLWIAKRNNSNETPVEGDAWTLFLPASGLSVGSKNEVIVVGPTDWRLTRRYNTVDELLADDGSGPIGIGYSGSGASVIVSPGNHVYAEGFEYEVAPPDSIITWQLETVGGVKLYPLPLQTGGANIRQFGSDNGDANANGSMLEKLVDYVTDRGIKGTIHISGGDYTMTKGLSLPKGCEWICPEIARLNFTGVASADLPFSQGAYRACVAMNGSRSALPDLASNVTKGSRTISFVSAHNLVPSQVFDIYDPTDFSFQPGNAIFRNSQRFRVMKVIDSTSVQVDEVSDFNFNSSIVQCYFHNSWTGSIEGIDVLGNGDTSSFVIGISTDYAADVNINRCSVSGAISYVGMGIGRSIDVLVKNCRVTEDGINSSGNDYGYANLSSRRVTAEDCYFAGARHGWTHGTISGDVLWSKSRLIRVEDGSLDPASEAASADFHGGGYDGYVENCIMSNGIILSGKGPFRFIDCTFHNIKPYGFCVFASQPAGGLYEFIRPKIIIRDKSSGTVSIFHLGAGAATQFACLTEDATYRIRDIDIDGDIAGQPYIVSVGTDNIDYKVNIDIDGVTDNNVTSRVAVLSCFRHISTPIAADFIKVTNVRKMINGGEYARWSATYPNPTRYQFDDQGGVVTLSSGTSAFVSQTVTYRFKYPTLLPIQAFTDINSPFQIGAEMIDSRALSKTYQNLNLNIYTLSGSNFPSNSSVVCSWRVGCGN